MTPAEIAAKLTPAQVRALTTKGGTVQSSVIKALHQKGVLEPKSGLMVLTPLGRAVLAELEGK